MGKLKDSGMLHCTLQRITYPMTLRLIVITFYTAVSTTIDSCWACNLTHRSLGMGTQTFTLPGFPAHLSEFSVVLSSEGKVLAYLKGPCQLILSPPPFLTCSHFSLSLLGPVSSEIFASVATYDLKFALFPPRLGS